MVIIYNVQEKKIRWWSFHLINFYCDLSEVVIKSILGLFRASDIFLIFVLNRNYLDRFPFAKLTYLL
jgi:hypothetical protein